MSILKVFIGLDKRVPRDFTVLQHSIHVHASKPVAVIPLVIDQLPIERRGLTDFTYTRYLVPHLCGNKNERAVFLDSDMLLMDDIHKMIEDVPLHVPVSVVKNKERFEWPSLMVFNCGHSDCKKLTPDYLDNPENKPQSFDWVTSGDDGVGNIPEDWNYCIGYDEPDKGKDAKLLHYTMGTPGFETIMDAQLGGEYEWTVASKSAMSGCSWEALHLRSVHAQKILDRLIEVTSTR